MTYEWTFSLSRWCYRWDWVGEVEVGRRCLYFIFSRTLSSQERTERQYSGERKWRGGSSVTLTPGECDDFYEFTNAVKYCSTFLASLFNGDCDSPGLIFKRHLFYVYDRLRPSRRNRRRSQCRRRRRRRPDYVDSELSFLHLLGVMEYALVLVRIVCFVE